MKVVVVYLDFDGYEAYREEYEWGNIPEELKEIVDEMVEAGVIVRQVGDKIVEIYK